MGRWRTPAILVLGLTALAAIGYLSWTGSPQGRAVLYCAQDEPFAVQVLETFRAQTGIEVAPKFDTEASKSVGLYQEIVQDRERPRCDVFWNNEILSMIRLQRQGLLEPYDPPSAGSLVPFPPSAQTPDHAWHAFAARARILLINTRLLPRESWPESLLDLTEERYRGKVALALPHHGTSATHAACLFEVLGAEEARRFYRGLRENEAQLAPGNKDVAVWTAQGRAPTGREVAIGVTDTDDAMAEVRAGREVVMLYPDRKGAARFPRLGTLYIPNTIGLIRGGPSPEAGKKLVDYLLSEEVERRLAGSASCQVPFRPSLREVLPPEIEYPPAVKAMEVDFARAADLWDEGQAFLRNEIIRP